MRLSGSGGVWSRFASEISDAKFNFLVLVDIPEGWLTLLCRAEERLKDQSVLSADLSSGVPFLIKIRGCSLFNR